MRTSDRAGSRLVWATVLPLALVLALAGGLAWTAIEADRGQRRAAEGTVADYTDFAAFILAGEAEARLRQTLLYAFYREELAWRRDSATVDPAALLADPQEAGRCAQSAGHSRWAARLDVDDGLETAGDIDATTRTWVADTLRSLAARSGDRAVSAGHLIAPAGDAGAVLAYRVRRAGPDSTAVAAYALTSCFSDRDGPVLDGALAAGPLLPPTLVGEVEADSLLSVRVTHPITGVLYRSSREYESAYVGTALLSDPGVGGGARLDVTLRPAVADRLLRENVGPYSRAPLALGLLVATVALILVATVLLVRAVRLARLRERFVADVSHELRTPLQQVLLFAQLLRIGQERSAEERVRFLSIIEREALRLIALVERVLEFARPNGIGDRADDEDRADVAAVVRAAVDAIGPLLAERSARVTLDLPDTAVARASSDAVHQIVLNLLDNALKYGPAGQSIGIRVATGRDVRLEVADDGPGVPAADRSLVWEPFYRLEREESAARAGSGIGLAVVRELAERFGALTEVEDAPGGGALFRVRFQPAVAS